MSLNFKSLEISDIHLGHDGNKTITILEHLEMFFKEHHKTISKVNVININGDIFDKLLLRSSIDFKLSMDWLCELMWFCSLYNIKLRILEGTASHDWKQAKNLQDTLKSYKIIDKESNLKLDFKYIDTLHIEYMEEFDIHILYVPDDYKKDSTETYLEILELMKQNNITEVDFVKLHGAFNYQLPIKLPSNHNEKDYESITKYCINSGHIHTPSVFGKIICSGSFDRICHGEEHDKGGVLVNIVNGELTYKFLVNKNATIYKTFDYINLNDIEDIIKDLDTEIKKYPINSKIRIFVNDDVFLKKSIEELTKRFKHYVIKVEKKTTNENNKKIKILEDDVEDTSFNITPENIKELLFKEMTKYELDSLSKNICNEEFDNIFNNTY